MAVIVVMVMVVVMLAPVGMGMVLAVIVAVLLLTAVAVVVVPGAVGMGGVTTGAVADQSVTVVWWWRGVPPSECSAW